MVVVSKPSAHSEPDWDSSDEEDESVYSIPSSVQEYEKLTDFLEQVVIFLDDLEPGHGACTHTVEPPEWVLWDRMSQFGEITHVTSMEMHGQYGQYDRVCFVVYAKVSHALAARKIFKDHNMEGRFIRMKAHFISLAKYSLLISNALCDSPEVLKMHTDCRIDPLYDPSTDITRGYVVPNLQILGHIAPPVPGDVMKRLFFPRTFTKLHGEKEGAITLKQGQQPPYPFDDSDDYGDPYEHLAPPHDPWPMAKQPRHEHLERMKSHITTSLLHGEKVTLISPLIAERSSKKSKEQKSGNAPKLTRGLKPPRLDSYDPQSIITITIPIRYSGNDPGYLRRSVWKTWDKLHIFGEISYIIGHERIGAAQREFYVAYVDNACAAKARDNFVSSDICSLQPHGSVPAEFGSWLSRLCADVRYKRPAESQWLVFIAPSFDRGKQIELTTKGVSDPGTLPPPIPQAVAVSPSAQDSIQRGHPPCLLCSNYGINDSSVSREQSLQCLLLPDDSSRPVESQMFAASQLLAQIEVDLTAKQPDAVPNKDILNVLQRVTSLPDDWIPDDDLYNIRRRASKLLTATGMDSKAPSAVLAISDPNPAPLPAPQALPLASSMGGTATKRCLEEDLNADDCGRQSSKRGRFSPDYVA